MAIASRAKTQIVHHTKFRGLHVTHIDFQTAATTCLIWTKTSHPPTDMQRDSWLSPCEKIIFNERALEWNSELLPLIHTDNYLTAFFRVHRRFNNAIPQWATGPASQFVGLVTTQWDSCATEVTGARFLAVKRSIVIGAARRICSLQLRMDATDLERPDCYEVAERRGLLFYVPQEIADENTHTVQRFDSADVWARVEALELISIIGYLFGSIGAMVFHLADEPHFRFQPYYEREPPSRRFSPPERRLTSSLAYAAFHVWHASGGTRVKSPYRLLPPVSGGKVQFSASYFANKAAVTDEANPLIPTLSYLAGKLLHCKLLGKNVR